MKIIGLDVGEKRIGVAIADTSVKIAIPHSTILVDGSELDQIVKLMKGEGTSLLVVGLPRNSKGEETAQTKVTRLFATGLQSRGAKVKFQDESLTSVLAERRLKVRKSPYTKADIDRESATIILQDFIEGVSPQNHTEVSSPQLSSQKTPKEYQPTPEPLPNNFEENNNPRIYEPKNKRVRSKAPIVSICILALVTLLSATTLWTISQSQPISSNPLRHPFIVTPGQSTSAISEELVSEGLIKNSLAFTISARLTGANIPAGTHFLAENETTWQIIDQLSN